ncbi:PLDc N-terminal domain-containing protein [Clostridium botulinum]|nr:hypothetical protein RSJ15_04690 [Clostridium botulinum]
MMTHLGMIIPIILLIIHLALMIFCLSKLFRQDFTNYLSKQLWIFIIMFFSIIGPISYLHFENWEE